MEIKVPVDCDLEETVGKLKRHLQRYQPPLKMRRLALRIHEYLTFFCYEKKIYFCRGMKSFIALLVSRGAILIGFEVQILNTFG